MSVISTEYSAEINTLFIRFNAELFAHAWSPELVEGISTEINQAASPAQSYVIVSLNGEGVRLIPLVFMSRVITILIEKYLMPKEKFLIVTGAYPSNRNRHYYAQLRSKHNLIPIPVVFVNGYEHGARGWLLSNEEALLAEIDLTPRVKSKLLLSFNGNSRLHRLLFVHLMKERGLIDKSFVSWKDVVRNSYDLANLTGLLLEFFPKYGKKWYDQMLNKLPIEMRLLNLSLAPGNNQQPMFPITPDTCANDFEYTNNCYFSVVTETKFLHDNDLRDINGKLDADTQADGYLFSEKTWKPIMSKHPFIFMGFVYSLALLWEHGYQTFHPYINESYDSVENDEDRLVAICDEIERLSKFTDDEWITWQINVQPILEHNFQRLKNTKRNSITFNPETQETTALQIFADGTVINI